MVRFGPKPNGGISGPSTRALGECFGFFGLGLGLGLGLGSGLGLVVVARSRYLAKTKHTVSLPIRAPLL